MRFNGSYADKLPFLNCPIVQPATLLSSTLFANNCRRVDLLDRHKSLSVQEFRALRKNKSYFHQNRNDQTHVMTIGTISIFLNRLLDFTACSCSNFMFYGFGSNIMKYFERITKWLSMFINVVMEHVERLKDELELENLRSHAHIVVLKWDW